ncbi:RnfABCDGE type electron transport complex subunit D [bacterium]|nr:RnfABCDGE type electron transport complex subunit D [bacterium]
MKFRIKPAPFQRSTKRTTKGIMLELSLVLVVVWFVAILMNYTLMGEAEGTKTILMGDVALVAAFVTDVVTALIIKKNVWQYFVGSYSYVTALIFVLTLPVTVSYYAIVVGIVLAIVFGKIVFGGFGYNPINPAGLGRIIVALSFSLAITGVPGLVSDATTSATITSALNWKDGILPDGFSLGRLFLGNYAGAIGETSALTLLIAGIYLSIRKIADPRLMVSYTVSAFLITLFMGLAFGVANPFVYGITHILVGGLAFGAVFMVTDPVTTPTSPMGKIIFGLGAAAITILIRVSGALPEGVVFSIVFMNLLTPIIDGLVKGKTTDKIGQRWGVILALLVLAIGINIGVAFLGGVA